jgi:hypothetical protein
MGEEYPREAAFDSQGNPLFTSDGNLASAADAARFPKTKLYAGGDSLYSGPVYDGRGRQVRGGGNAASVPIPSQDFVGDAIDKGLGSLFGCAIVGFFLVVTEPLDRWLMDKAKEQTSRADELEKEVASARGYNFGGFLPGPLSCIWLLLFLRFPFALIPVALLTVVNLVPLFGQLTLLLTWGLVLVRGNEWAWYSGKWATVDDLMAAKRRWAYALIGLYAVMALVSIATR